MHANVSWRLSSRAECSRVPISLSKTSVRYAKILQNIRQISLNLSQNFARELQLDGLERGDWGAEGLALLGVGHPNLEARLPLRTTGRMSPQA